MRRPGFISNIKVDYNGQLVDIGRRVRRYRTLWDDMTQAELAERAKLSSGYISQIELNRVTPTEETLSKIARAFGVTVPELLGTC